MKSEPCTIKRAHGPGCNLHTSGFTVLMILLLLLLAGITTPAQAALTPPGEDDPKMAALMEAVRAIVNENHKFNPVTADAFTQDQFGRAVSLDGNRALVGAQFDDDAGTSSGSAYIFDFNGTSWVQTQKLTALDAASGDQFGASVSLDGSRALIGAPFDNFSTGAVYVFELSGTWSQTAKLVASDATGTSDRAGASVSLDGSRALIGAPFDEDSGGASGSAYIWDLSSGVWSQTTQLLAGDAALGNQFGTSVSLDGSRALVGAIIGDGLVANSGAAYIFDLSGTWSQTQELNAGDGASGDQFGKSVSLDGSTALIGAPFDDDAGSLSGSAYVFDLSGTWSQTQKLTASDDAGGDQFGTSVALEGTRLVIGSPQDDYTCPTTNINCGSAYRFDLSGTWSETDKLQPSDAMSSDNFGFSTSVSLSGGRVLIGSPNDDDDGSGSGSVYVFDFTTTNSPPTANAGPNQTIVCANPAGESVTLDGSGSSDPDAGDMLLYTWREGATVIAGPTTNDMSTVTLPPGSHTITLTVDDGNGGINIDVVFINVLVDTAPPDVIATLNTALGSGNGCSECKGGVVELTLEYKGTGGTITAVSGDDTYAISLDTDNKFTIEGMGKNGKFDKNEVEFFVDTGSGDVLVAVFHVSCSDVIGPGTTEQDGNKHDDPNGMVDFTVVEALSREGGLVCPVDSDACSQCKGGVIELTLEYNGSGGTVTAISGDDTYLIGPLATNDTFTIQGMGNNGKFDKNEVDFFVGTELVATFHVSCSDVIGPGTTEQDGSKHVDPNDDVDFTVVEAISKDGGLVCPGDTNGEGDFIALCDVTDTCDEDPTITALILVPTLSPATIEFKVKNKKKLKFELAMDKLKVEAPDPAAFWAQVLADGGIKVSNGRRFDIDEKPGSDKFEYKFDNAGNLKQVKGPEVTLKCTAIDAAGNMAMDEAGPDFPCDECKGGVVELTLQYDGTAAATIEAESGKTTYNVGTTVTPGSIFTLNGTGKDGKFEKNSLKVFVDGVLNTDIHVSCSQPINPGLSFGDFTIVEAIIKNGGPVCPLSGANASVLGVGLFAPEAAVPERSSEAPSSFALWGNYPNPFNPETTIRFSVPESAQVRLVVYDVLGRQVRVLVDGVRAAGRHKVVFDASDLSSGTYLYRLETPAGSFVQMMRLVK